MHTSFLLFLVLLSIGVVVVLGSKDGSTATTISSVVDKDGALSLSNQDQTTNHEAISFGHELLKSKFLLNYTNFNHGSFGACPKPVLKYQSELRLQQEQQPDPWMRIKYRQMMNDTRRQIAAYVNADSADNVVLVESASTAVNALLRSFAWDEGDQIAYFNLAYAMVKNTAKFLQEQWGIDIVEIPVQLPISESVGGDAFVKPLQELLQNLEDPSKLKAVVLDHITSCPGIKTPVNRLATLVKTYAPNAFVLVDGAHAAGQVQKLDLQALVTRSSENQDNDNITKTNTVIDAYLSNGHKWLYSPKGSAFLWVSASQISEYFPEPTVISSANPMNVTTFSNRFVYTSTRDYTALLSLSAALDFRQDDLGGDEAIYDYVRNLAIQARRYLLELWNTTAMAPESMEEFMINIGLPIPPCTKLAKALQDYLLDQHGMYVVIVAVPPDEQGQGGMVYARLSAQVYLELSDFERLGEAVLEFAKNSTNTTTATLGQTLTARTVEKDQ